MQKAYNRIGGFTLIELLIVIAILGLLASIVFVALDPLTRFRDARDARRWSDIASLISAIKVQQIDNGGLYTITVSSTATGEVYMITDGNVVSGCDNNNSYCDVDVTDDNSCVNLKDLVTEGYLGGIPVSPNGEGTWTSSLTGYTLQRDDSGILTIRACESENSDAIWVAR